MKKPKSSTRALYERLYVSAQDFRFAAQCTRYLLKKGWHSAPYERRGTIYLQQAALTSSVIVSYSRPFTKGKGWPPFPMSLAPYDRDQMNLHRHIIGLRHQVYAHSDSSRHSVRPLQLGEYLTDMVGTPFLRLTAQECESIVGMMEGIQARLLPELVRLRQHVQNEVPEPNAASSARW